MRAEIPFPLDFFVVLGGDIQRGIPSFLFFQILAAFIVGWMLQRLGRKRGLPQNTLLTAYLLALIFGLLGAKLFYALELWPRIWVGPADFLTKIYYIATYYRGLAVLYPNMPAAIGFYQALRMPGGLVFYGALICGVGIIVLYLKNQRQPLRAYLDLFALALALAYTIGRLGCFISGDGCFGTYCPLDSNLFGFVHGNVDGSCNQDPALAGIHPLVCTHGVRVWNTPLAESLASLGLFLILWILYNRKKSTEILVATFMFGHGLARFLIEFIRLNDALWPILKAPTIPGINSGGQNTFIKLPHLFSDPASFAPGQLPPALFFRYWHWYGFTQAQLIAFMLMVAGLVLFLIQQHCAVKHRVDI